MTALPVPPLRRMGDRIRSVAETVYAGPTPQAGPGLAAKARFTAYVIGSSLAWGLAALVVVGLLASIFR